MNKTRSWVTMLGMASIFASPVLEAVAQPNTVTSTMNVTCKANTSVPKVVASFANQENARDLTILSFLSQYFSSPEALKNCENTAKTLQKLYTSGRANYLTNDKLNTQPVVCAVERRGIGCSHYSAQVLFTFNEKVNASQALYEMLGSDFKQPNPPDSRTVSRIYSDIKLSKKKKLIPFLPF
ncbi:COP23 domain-containing protein [Fischerella sp. JS2]|uniref:COP23 domain-containing protein n=1 Tax=Fischerella sp. JS2 TaxID=2597771 RepID=UPI0028EA7D5E|nr:COP23 domain-containing protein [Fischerella sp. JS2]